MKHFTRFFQSDVFLDLDNYYLFHLMALDAGANALRARESSDIPSVLGFREGMNGAINTLTADSSKREFGGTSTNVLSANCPCQCVFDLAARAAGGRHYVLCGAAKYSRC